MSQFATGTFAGHVNKLSEQYKGVEVSLDAAEGLLGYRPAIGDEPARRDTNSLRLAY
jgi:hypothetical protein